MTPTQFGLFQGPENVKSQDATITVAESERLEEELQARPYSELEVRLKIVRGFLALHFSSDPDEILKRPLRCLGGKTLESLCHHDYKMVLAWIQEYRLHPDEKDQLIETLSEEKLASPPKEKISHERNIKSPRRKKQAK